MDRGEAQAYWNKGVSLKHAGWHFMPSKLRTKCENAHLAQCRRTRETTLISLDPPEYADVSWILIGPDDGLISGAEDKIHDWIYQEIRNGNLIALGYCLHGAGNYVEEIPATAFDRSLPTTSFHRVKWEDSRIHWSNKIFINVRIARLKTNFKQRNSDIALVNKLKFKPPNNQPLGSPKKGRRSYRKPIVDAYEALKKDGQIDFSASLTVAIDKIGDLTVRRKALGKKPSWETVRKYISSDFNALKRSV